MYRDRPAFYVVYIQVAHASDLWQGEDTRSCPDTRPVHFLRNGQPWRQGRV